MSEKKVRWVRAYKFVEPGINADGIHTYPFDPSFPIDVGFHIHAGRNNVRMNRHVYMEVIYICAGSTEMQILNRTFRVRGGDLLVIGPDIFHRIRDQSNMEVKLTSMNFQPEVVRGTDVSGNDDQYLMPFFFQDAHFPHVISRTSSIPRQVFDFMKRIYAELPATTAVSRLAVRTYLKMILLLLVRHYSTYLGTQETIQHQRRSMQRLQPLFEYLGEHYDKRIHTREAARICAMSSSHFMSFFKRVTGQPFLAYLNAFRVSKGQSLLVSTDRPLSEISGELGFCSQSYFGRIFRNIVGATPLDYRRRFGKVIAPSLAPQPLAPHTKLETRT